MSAPSTFTETVGRLDEIVDAVRRKDTSLEESLDLLDEAIALGLAAVEMVDDPHFSPEELDGAPAAQGEEPAVQGPVVAAATRAVTASEGVQVGDR